MAFETLFLTFFNMSITASFVVVAVLVLRLLLSRIPKIFSYALWAVVLFRLLCPISFESALSLLPINPEPVPPEILYQTVPEITSGLEAIDVTINPVLPAPAVGASVNPLQIITFIFAVVWILGVATMTIVGLIGYLKLRRNLVGALCFKDNIFLADNIPSPFVSGIFRPRIFLPSSLSESERVYIIAHENHHIKRLDHITRAVAFLALALHWYNPLVWLAFHLSAKDMELSCDEAVIKSLDKQLRANYSESLLRFSTGKRLKVMTPLAFSESDTKSRVKNIVRYKKPILLITAVALVAVVLVGFSLSSNPIITIKLVDAETVHLTEQFISGITSSAVSFNGNETDLNSSQTEKLLEFVRQIEVEKNEKSKDLSENRDKENVLTLYFGDNSKYDLNFNSNFSEVYLDNFVKPSYSYYVITEAGEITNALNSIVLGFDIETAWSNRTKYIGDNSAVINIVSAFDFGEGVVYDGISLETAEQPYSLTVNLKATEDIVGTSDVGGTVVGTTNYDLSDTEKKADVMFSLIENVDNISFKLTDNAGLSNTQTYYRNESNVFFEDEEQREDFYEFVYSVYSVPIILSEQEISGNFGVSTFKGAELYIWKDQDGETFFTLLSGTNALKTPEQIYDKAVATDDIDDIIDVMKQFEDGTVIFINQVNEQDFTIDEISEFNDYITKAIGDEVQGFSLSIGQYQPVVTGDETAAEVEPPQSDLIPMVMIDGIIYFDTGELLSGGSLGHDSSFDGFITSSVPQSERPTQNDQSNFGIDIGYKITADGFAALYLNEEWYRFAPQTGEVVHSYSTVVEPAVSYEDIEELAEQAEIIVIGTASEISPMVHEGGIVPVVTFTEKEVLKGNFSQPLLVQIHGAYINANEFYKAQNEHLLSMEQVRFELNTTEYKPTDLVEHGVSGLQSVRLGEELVLFLNYDEVSGYHYVTGTEFLGLFRYYEQSDTMLRTTNNQKSEDILVDKLREYL